MIKANNRHTIGALLGVGLAALLIWGLDDKSQESSAESRAYYHNEGKVFGTYYNIRYEATEDLKDSIHAAFEAFDASLSLFNPHSILSAINANRDTTTNAFFEAMWAEAEEVYAYIYTEVVPSAPDAYRAQARVLIAQGREADAAALLSEAATKQRPSGETSPLITSSNSREFM